MDDWRLPNIKELWSIRDFSAGWPWVDTDYFHLVGDGSQGGQQHSWSSDYYLVDTEEAVTGCRVHRRRLDRTHQGAGRRAVLALRQR